MKIAVLSDVHGFSPALSRVLEDIQTRSADQIVAAGDICAHGPDPAGSIRLLQKHNCSVVFGNTDRDVLNASSSGNGELSWTRSQLGSDDLDWLRALPFSVRIPHPASNPQDNSAELLVVHANPVDVNRHLSPNLSDRELLEIIGDEPARTIAFGHLHVAYTRQVGPYNLVDVSAVGPPRDGDLRPRYVIFDSDSNDADWRAEYYYVDYPLDETQALMEVSGMPQWEKAWTRLNEATYRRQI